MSEDLAEKVHVSKTKIVTNGFNYMYEGNYLHLIFESPLNR